MMWTKSRTICTFAKIILLSLLIAAASFMELDGGIGIRKSSTQIPSRLANEVFEDIKDRYLLPMKHMAGVKTTGW